MQAWTVSLILASGICAASGIVHLGVARRDHRVGLHFWVGLASLVVAVASLLMALVHHAGDEFSLLRVPYIGVMVFVVAVVVTTVVLGLEAVRRSCLAVEVGRVRWRALLDNLDLAIVAYDTTGQVIYVNPYLVRISGRPEEEIVGSHLGQNVAVRYQDRFESALKKILAGEAMPSLEVASVLASGEERLVVWSTVIFEDDLGIPVEFVAVGADVTDRRDAERSRDYLRRELDRLSSVLAEESITLVEGPLDLTVFAGIVGESRLLEEALNKVRQVAPTESTVLLAR